MQNLTFFQIAERLNCYFLLKDRLKQTSCDPKTGLEGAAYSVVGVQIGRLLQTLARNDFHNND